jgi:hypothetical protein
MNFKLTLIADASVNSLLSNSQISEKADARLPVLLLLDRLGFVSAEMGPGAALCGSLQTRHRAACTVY